jgi:transposase
MQTISEIETIKRKFELLGPMLDEKMRRLWGACESYGIGPEGENIVAIATGISKADIRMGLQELLDQSKPYPLFHKTKRRRQQERIRRPGGGRKLVEVKDPSILTAIENIIENDIAGDPMSRKKWVRISTKEISNRLKEVGYYVSSTTVSRLLKDSGYSMRANKKRKIRENNPARDQQFKYIALQRKKFSGAGLR